MSKGGGVDTSGQNDAARKMSDIAGQMWDQYKTTYLPMENQYVQDAQNYDTPEHRELYAGRANADVHQAFAQQRDEQTRQLASYGINPDSGKFATVNARLQGQEAAAAAGAQNQARLGVEQEGWNRRTNALSLGKGLPAQASAGYQGAGGLYGSAANTQLAANRQQSDNFSNMSSGAYLATQGSKDGSFFGMKDGGLVDVPGIRRHYAGGGMVTPGGIMGMAGKAANTSAPSSGGRQSIITPQNAMMAARVGRGIYKYVNRPQFGPSGTGETMDVGGLDAGQTAGEAATATDAAPGAVDMTTGAAVGGDAAAGGAAAGGAAAGDAAAAGGAAAADAIGTATAAEAAGAATAEVAPELLALALLADGGQVGHGINAQPGGAVSGPGTETSDSIPAMLSDGEYVINAEAVKHFGVDRLNKMNEVGLKTRYGLRK